LVARGTMIMAQIPPRDGLMPFNSVPGAIMLHSLTLMHHAIVSGAWFDISRHDNDIVCNIIPFLYHTPRNP
ncbi:MAG: hypothetical protein Q4D19_14190, partial [Lautropia sp.]|nr:hypothetical protein [Lautropia sp.]